MSSERLWAMLVRLRSLRPKLDTGASVARALDRVERHEDVESACARCPARAARSTSRTHSCRTHDVILPSVPPRSACANFRRKC